MILALAAAMLLGAAPAPDPGQAYGARLGESAAAAQALEGALDGRWTLRDARGRTLYLLEIADPAQHAGPLQAAWTDPATGAMGPVETLSREGERLRVVFAAPGGAVGIELWNPRGHGWRGRLVQNAVRRAVRLTRD
jgi:hypothetical protein